MAHRRIIAGNKRASYDYFLEDRLEVGIVLIGTEVKALRLSNGNINDSYVYNQGGELFLFNSYIAPYNQTDNNHEPRRVRKLLCHKHEIRKMIGKIRTKGYTLIPTSLYINEKNIMKLEIALGKGKKLHDKRKEIAKRDEARYSQRQQG